MAQPRIGILTISDRASQGVYEDKSGPAIEAALRDFLATDCEFDKRVIADERELIGSNLRELAAAGCCLICTTGGTGPSPRDVTPEAIRDVCHKELPGFGELMRAASLHGIRGPEEVAKLIAFLTSDDARHISGEELRIDGAALA